MGVLDRLLFWRDDDADCEQAPQSDQQGDYEVNGCFTLPTDGEGETSVQPAAD